MARVLFLVASFWWFNTGYGQTESPHLTLEQVLLAAAEAFPTLLATEQRRLVAEGELTAAEGGFDTVFKSQNRWSVIGLYENQNYDVGLEQPTALWGATFFGGWRRGTGDFPVYDGKGTTANEGEARLGVSVPLWRNRSIDRRRANLQQAELGQVIAGHDLDLAKLDIRRQASYRYWDWVLAGERLAIASQLLAIAEQRDAGIRERVAAGDLPEFDALDNQRAIIERQERRVAAQRWLEQTAIQLSLYWRDGNGEPQLPVDSQLPSFPDQPPRLPLAYAEALKIAVANRPELRRISLQSKQMATEQELQKNQMAPGVDVAVIGAQDFGSGKSDLNRNELYVGLNLDIPLQQRIAIGRSQAAGANVQRLKWEGQLLQDRIAAETKDVFSALSATQQRRELAKMQRQAAKQLEEGERTRFQLGESNLLFVNLRELASGDAALAVAEASNNLFKAYADYQAVLALDIN